jgi:hypothetical protein
MKIKSELNLQDLSLQKLFRLRDNVQMIYDVISNEDIKVLQDTSIKDLGDLVVKVIRDKVLS